MFYKSILVVLALLSPVVSGSAANASIDDAQIELDTLFIEAIRSGQIATAENLLAAGANIDGYDRYGYTALHHVCGDDDNIAMAQWLITRAADVNANKRNHDFLHSPLFMASNNGHVGIVRLLLENGADVARFGPNAMNIAITIFSAYGQSEYLDIMELLLDYGVQYKSPWKLRTLIFWERHKLKLAGATIAAAGVYALTK